MKFARTLTWVVCVPLLALNFLFLADTIRQQYRHTSFVPAPFVLKSQPWVEPLIDSYISQHSTWKKSDYFISASGWYFSQYVYYAINQTKHEFDWPNKGAFMVFYIDGEKRSIVDVERSPQSYE